MIIHAGPARAQSAEPRTYSPAPVGMNFAIVGFAQTTGGLSVDPAIPLKDVKLTVPTALFAYARSLNLFGSSGKVDVIVPYGKLSGSAMYNGQEIERRVNGFADPLIRLSMVLYGAPAMTPAAFRNYHQNLIIAASVQVSVPVGQYDPARLLNLGTHRWSVKSELGAAKRWGRWTVEAAIAGTFYGTNPDFFGGGRRTQAPVFSGRGHLIYSLPSGPWAAFDATYFTGGETDVDGINQRNLQRNWRMGLTLAAPISKSVSLKLNASKGVSARTGNNFDLIGLALQYRWAS